MPSRIAHIASSPDIPAVALATGAHGDDVEMARRSPGDELDIRIVRLRRDSGSDGRRNERGTQVSGGELAHDGTQYAPPEQIRGEDVGYDSDVYSICATLYYLLTARAPYQHESMTAALAV
jgi:hypothetical protein